MRFHERDYDFFVMLIPSGKALPWVAKEWTNLSKMIEPIFAQARGKASVRSTQWDFESKRHIGFGRLSLSDASSQKWLHSKDGSLLSGSSAHFMSCEAWAPSWTNCKREDQAPDVFFVIENAESPQQNSEAGKTVFKSTLMLATAVDLDSDFRSLTKATAIKIANFFEANLRAYQERPWGYSCGSGFTNAIQDLSMSGLFHPGPRHEKPVTIQTLKGTWTSF